MVSFWDRRLAAKAHLTESDLFRRPIEAIHIHDQRANVVVVLVSLRGGGDQ